jgi:hypothetical protein
MKQPRKLILPGRPRAPSDQIKGKREPRKLIIRRPPYAPSDQIKRKREPRKLILPGRPRALSDQTKGKLVAVPHPETIRDTIRTLAQDTANIEWRTRAQERMPERDITDKMALDVLRKGHQKGPIEPGRHMGEWKVKLVLEMRGGREVGVVVVVAGNVKLRVITVEWEDPQ